MSLENQWRQCVNCLGLFYAGEIDATSGAPDLGDCPATGGPHVANSGFGLLAIRDESRPGAQDGWRRCGKCQGMFYGLAPASVCPEDHFPHVASADGAVFAVGTGAARGSQPGWRYCHKCQGLWLATGPGGATCPAGGAHDRVPSSEYAVAFEQHFQPPLMASGLSATSGDTFTRAMVAVSDGAGNPVKGLAAEHFRVYRENAPLTLISAGEVAGLDGVYFLRLSFLPGTGFKGSNALLVKVMRDWQNQAVAMAPLVHVP